MSESREPEVKVRPGYEEFKTSWINGQPCYISALAVNCPDGCGGAVYFRVFQSAN